jgi:hypothetical protein
MELLGKTEFFLMKVHQANACVLSVGWTHVRSVTKEDWGWIALIVERPDRDVGIDADINS